MIFNLLLLFSKNHATDDYYSQFNYVVAMTYGGCVRLTLSESFEKLTNYSSKTFWQVIDVYISYKLNAIK